MALRIAPEGIDSFFDHFRTVQAEEAWAALGGWVEATRPGSARGSRERFAAAKAIDPAIAAPGRAFRRVLQARMRPLLTGGAVMVYPTSPCIAPLLTAGWEEQDASAAGDGGGDGNRRVLRVAGGDAAGGAGCGGRRSGCRWSRGPGTTGRCWRWRAMRRRCWDCRCDRPPGVRQLVQQFHETASMVEAPPRVAGPPSDGPDRSRSIETLYSARIFLALSRSSQRSMGPRRNLIPSRIKIDIRPASAAPPCHARGLAQAPMKKFI